MNAPFNPPRSAVMRFAEIVDEVGKRLHVGCVLAAGEDWVEVSLPEHTHLGKGLHVRFLPSNVSHAQPGLACGGPRGLHL